MLHEAIASVTEFHRKHGFTLGIPITCTKVARGATEQLVAAATVLDDFAKKFEVLCKSDYDDRLMRAHLLCEELGETLIGMARMDEVQVLDGLCDTAYVTLGAAAAFDLPISEAFAEVCRSNLTKGLRKATDLRCRDKGLSFVPPDIEGVLRRYRGDLEPEKRLDAEREQ